jgi:HD-like signal output (HDOD) protein
MPQAADLMENPIQLQVIADSLHNRLQNNAVHVPLLPQMVMSCLRVSRTPGAKPEQLSALLAEDQRMVDRLIQVSHTGFFGYLAEFNLNTLITHFGQQTVADLTLALSLNAGLFNAPGHTQYVAEQLRQAILCGLWSRQVALLRRRQIEAALICGLCKSIGRPVVIETALDCAVRHRMHLSYQDLMILADQFEYGATQKVLEAWQMPEVVHAVATHWLDYRVAGEAREQTMTTAAGARLASVFGKGGSNASRIALARDRVFTDLGITGKQLDKLCESAAPIAAVADTFV